MSAQPIPHYGPVDRRSNGVLDVWVQQPTDNSPAANPNKATYTELWKGPWDIGKDVLTTISPGDTITAFHNWLGADRVYRIAPADAPYMKDSEGVSHQMKWLVESINVVEQKAGDHCTIRVVFEAGIDAEEGDVTQVVEGSEEWNLTWQPYTVSPYEFCSNTAHSPRILSPSNQLNRDWQATASRDNIEQYRLWAGKAEEVDGGGASYTAYAWTPNPKQTNTCYPTRYALTDAEALVWEKVQLGRNAIYHYPVLTYSRIYNSKGDFNPTDTGGDVADSIDYASDDMPEGCPFELKSFVEGDQMKDWKWIKTGDSVQTVNKLGKDNEITQYKRTEMWIGVSDYDENFYGNETFNHANQNGVTKGRWYKGCL